MSPKVITLPISKKKINILVATHGLSIVRAGLCVEAEEQWDKENPRSFTEDGKIVPRTPVESMQHYDRTFLYPTLKACSQAKVLPSYEDFSSLLDEDATAWINGVKEVNSSWLPDSSSSPDIPESEEDLQKKESSPINSISISETLPIES